MRRDGATRCSDLALAAAGLALIGAWEWSGLDLVVSRVYGSAGGFAWQHAWPARALLHDGGRIASALLLLALVIDALRQRLAGPPRRERCIGLSMTIACIVLVPALKHTSLTSCPWDLAEFGGRAAYVPHWLAGIADDGPGRCFPSGHAVAAFAFLGVWFVWRHARPRLACAWLAGVLLFGLLFGWAQVARGAHYVSHVLWSAWLCWAMCVALSWLSVDPARAACVRTDRSTERRSPATRISSAVARLLGLVHD